MTRSDIRGIPAFSDIARLIEGFRGIVSTWREHRRTADTLDSLGEHALRDIGLIESDLDRCRNAASAAEGTAILRRARRSRAGNW